MVGGAVEKLEPMCSTTGNGKWKTVWQFHKKLKRLPCDPVITLLGLFPKEAKSYLHSPPPSHPHPRTRKKEESSNNWYKVNKPGGRCVKWNSPVTRRQILWLHLHEVTRLVQLTETETRMVVARDEKGQGQLLLSKSSTSVGGVKMFADGRWWMHPVTLLHTD